MLSLKLIFILKKEGRFSKKKENGNSCEKRVKNGCSLLV